MLIKNITPRDTQFTRHHARWKVPNSKHPIEVWHAPDHGAIIRRGKSYWGTNDTDWEIIGVPNQSRSPVAPTVGPFDSFMATYLAYEAAIQKRNKG